MMLRALFVGGLALAVAGLVLSWGSLFSQLQFAGTLCFSGAISCGVFIMVASRNTPVDRALYQRSRKPMIAFTALIGVVAASYFIAEFRDYSALRYLQPAVVFLVTLNILLLQRVQGKVS